MSKNESIHVQNVRPCLLCSKEGLLLYEDLQDRLFSAPDTWDLLQCKDCGLIWLNPLPVPKDIGNLYKNYHTHSTNRPLPRLNRLRKAIRNSILTSHMGYSKLIVNPLLKIIGKILSCIDPIKEIAEMSVMKLDGQKKGKLLDVGCGNGFFLNKMRLLGWEVIGVEPDSEAVKVGQECFGLEIYEGTLKEMNFPDDSFDAVTMNHVIEHLFNPIEMLKECYRILKPCGRLVLMTPNIDSLGHKIFNKAWYGLDVPRHFYLFSTKTLNACAERAALPIEKLRTTARYARWIWEASVLIKRNATLPGGQPKKRSWSLRLGGFTFQLLEYLLNKLWKGIGEEIVLISSK